MNALFALGLFIGQDISAGDIGLDPQAVAPFFGIGIGNFADQDFNMAKTAILQNLCYLFQR